MRVLVACEYSGAVRRAFAAKGHDAWSCDLLPAEDDSPQHIQGDCLNAIASGWDLVIAHPPCTHLAVSGARWFAQKRADGRQQAAIRFFMDVVGACDRYATHWAVENPVCIMSSQYRKPDQTIQPWMFGHGETKATCLWLGNLPLLQPTEIVEGRENRIHKMPPGPNRWKERSRTYAGVAEAMASQWGALDFERRYLHNACHET